MMDQHFEDLQQFALWLEGELGAHQRAVEDFTQNLEPGNEHRWEYAPVKNGAYAMVYRYVLIAITPDKSSATLTSVKAYVLAESLNMASNPQRSSSPESNLFYTYKLAAWATLACALGLANMPKDA